ncbi:hypothetical protein FA13DRAFT_1633038 [Coprinellus micaceus]|uniref:RecQ mediated genome instability protein 1 OB-fold domain-containing protein n=1 Tax=Coprinellus micaceus TaxID=71717 RepID=A0A4Y7T3Y8_COPMI|nr:hypothetical protein FA13DRAFT_1633038 [Coprinellus micaceus]
MPYFDYDHIVHQLHESIQNSSLRDITVPGTGLAAPSNSQTAHGDLTGPLVLELVHMTEIGVSAFDLEGVRQERAHIRHQRRLATVRNVTGGRRQQQERRLDLPDYPRKRLKLFLTDGFIELEGIECGHLSTIALGKTPMGTKVHLFAISS